MSYRNLQVGDLVRLARVGIGADRENARLVYDVTGKYVLMPIGSMATVIRVHQGGRDNLVDVSFWSRPGDYWSFTPQDFELVSRA
jgi:hypothetical protein